METKLIKSFKVQRARYPAFCFPNIYNAVELTKKKFFDEIGCKLNYVAFLLRNNKRSYILGNLEDINNIRDSFLSKIIANKNFIKNKYALFDKNKQKLLKLVRKNLTKERIKILTNRKLLVLLADYYKYYSDFCAVVAPFIFIVNDALNHKIKKRIDPNHEFLLKSPMLSYVSSFELDYYKKCNFVACQLHKKWGWMPFDYIGPDEWDKEYFLKKMGVDIKKVFEIERDNEQLVLRQERTLKEYDNNTIRLIKDFHRLSDMQDNRKKITTITHLYLQKYLFEEISKRTKIEIKYIRIMTPREIMKALVFEEKFDGKQLGQRLESSLILFHNNNFSVHQVGDEIYKKFIDLLPKKKEIKGIVASKGIVRGNVRVCLTSKDIDKVKKGDILVTPMTTPDFLVAMNKAVGFITDEGGITCHAAIVSREMKKPCIIGTLFATEILKDDDYIELNANNCTIRKI